MVINTLNLFTICFLAAAVSAMECINDGEGSSTCKSALDDCMNPSQFEKLVSSYYQDYSLLPSLRGTIENIISAEDAAALIKSLPNFIEASGYDETSSGRAYSSPTGYSALGLNELKSSPEAYNKVIEIREQVRSATENALNICPGTLYIDFTTISQKVEGGAHRAHADSCIHFFQDGVAVCDTSRDHPYPKRVAAAILYLNDPATGGFDGGQFFFANRTNYGEVEDGGVIDISAGKMVYFTSGVENLHGALPVLKGKDIPNGTPRRLALAMWYVFDETLAESNEDNDPYGGTEILTFALPKGLDIDALLQSMGTFLVSRQNKPMLGSWKVSKYGDSTLHSLFNDHSAMFSVKFTKEVIAVARHTDTSQRASLQYMLQESVMLHSVLDEFVRLILDTEDTVDENTKANFRKGLDEARSKLPARQA